MTCERTSDGRESRECPGLKDPDDTAAWRMVRIGDREGESAQAEGVHLCVTPVGFYEMDGGHISFNDEGAESYQETKESWADKGELESERG